MREELQRALAELESRFDSARRTMKAKTGLRDPIRVRPYIGWGADGSLRLRGRVLEDEGVDELVEEAGVLGRLAAMFKRYESDEVPGAKVEASIDGRTVVLETNEEGFFDLELDDVALEAPWTEVGLRLLEPVNDDQDNPPVTGYVRVPGPRALRAVVSDIDDTIVKTGATDFFKHARTVLLNDAKSREPFAGIGAFYRALEAGPGGEEANPIFYVSSSPWNLFGLFESFLELHEIPLGPIFLKEFGFDEHKVLKSGHTEYKADRIERLLDTYPDLEFILVGDSGQKDAWVFEEVVKRRPGRVVGAYLRHLQPDRPDAEIDGIEERLRDAGVPMRRVPDMATAADHAHEMGWISDAQRVATRQSIEGEADA